VGWIVRHLGDEPFLCQLIDEIKNVPNADPTGIRNLLVKELKVFSSKGKFLGRPIFILTRRFDPEADLVTIKLLSKGIDCIRLNMEDIPRQMLIKYIINQDADSGIELKINNETLDISKISVAWLRHFDLTGLNFDMNEPARTFSFQQWNEAFYILLRTLNCKWINSPEAVSQANDRRKQLIAAKESGFDIPSTLITNDGEAAKKFYYSHNGNIVVKALHNHGVELDGKIYSMYTRLVTNQDLVMLSDLIYAPCILQEKLRKESEMRVTVVGDQVFAATLNFRSNYKKFDDLHRCSSADIYIKAHKKLRPLIIEQCIQLIKSLGLRYGAIDFVIDKSDQLIFLEVNPSGDWCWIERETGLPITAAMASLIEKLA
jgi:glutathione synthase/RimK-type ligase-like ATP-grasp enzyme